MPKMQASLEVVTRYFPKCSPSPTAQSIRDWALYFLRTNELPFSAQGKHAKVSSLILDEDIQQSCHQYMKSVPAGERTADALARWAETVLIPQLGPGFTTQTHIAKATACRWLHIIKWEYALHK